MKRWLTALRWFSVALELTPEAGAIPRGVLIWIRSDLWGRGVDVIAEEVCKDGTRSSVMKPISYDDLDAWRGGPVAAFTEIIRQIVPEIAARTNAAMSPSLQEPDETDDDEARKAGF